MTVNAKEFDDFMKENFNHHREESMTISDLKKHDTFAIEMIKEMKRSNERLYKITRLCLIVICILVLIIVSGLLWYLKQPKQETTTTSYSQQLNNKGENSTITQTMGK